MKETIYVPEPRFKIRSVTTEWNKGWIFFCRYLWNIRVEQGKWWQMFLFHFIFFFVMLPIMLVFDFLVAVVRIIGIIAMKIIELLFELLKALITTLITALGKPIAWGLVIIVLTVIFIAFFYNWQNITELINNLIHKFI